MGSDDVTEILDALSSKGIESVNIVIEEAITDIPGNGGQTARYDLKYSSKSPFFEQRGYLHLVGPDEMCGGNDLHAYYNLSRLVEQPLKADLPVSQQVKLAKKTLEAMALIDPRIKGEGVEPVVRIARVGNEKFDLEFTKAFYLFIINKT